MRPAIWTLGPKVRHRGFTAIELLVVVAIAAILASVAYPSLRDQVFKVRRIDGIVALTVAQLAEERWRADRTAYGALTDIGVAPVSSAGHYTLQVVATSATGYSILASAQGTQSRDADCRNLLLQVDGANVDYASGSDTSVANPASANRRCWSL